MRRRDNDENGFGESMCELNLESTRFLKSHVCRGLIVWSHGRVQSGPLSVIRFFLSALSLSCSGTHPGQMAYRRWIAPSDVARGRLNCLRWKRCSGSERSLNLSETLRSWVMRIFPSQNVTGLGSCITLAHRGSCSLLEPASWEVCDDERCQQKNKIHQRRRYARYRMRRYAIV